MVGLDRLWTEWRRGANTKIATMRGSSILVSQATDVLAEQVGPVKIQFIGYGSGPGRSRLQLGDALTWAAYEV